MKSIIYMYSTSVLCPSLWAMYAVSMDTQVLFTIPTQWAHYTDAVMSVQPLSLSLHVPCPPTVALISEKGDADIYASTEVKEPDYTNSQFSSSSCGLDLLVVPSSSKAGSQRIHIVVVGHSRHAESTYRMFIITPAEEDIRKYQVTQSVVAVLVQISQTSP